jgi:hypothetical protein
LIVRRLLVLAALAAATLTMPSPAGAGQLHPQKRAGLSVTFVAVTRDGHPVAVKRVRFRGLVATCTQGGVHVHGRLPRMPVHHRRFGHLFRKHGHRIEIHGRFRNHNRLAKGTLRLQGKINAGGQHYTRCDSGTQRWAVGRS